MTRHVAIIGAGPAGLAAAVSLQRHGVSHTVLERGTGAAAGIRTIDPEMELLSPTAISLVPGLRREATDPAYLTFPAYANKLERLVADQRVPLRSGADVARIDRLDGGAGFAVHLRDGSVVDCTHVVNATGIVSFPRLPPSFNPATARYRWLHSREFRTSHLAAARRLLVVGGGQSATEVLERWLATRREGDRAWVSMRSRALALPRWVLGIDVHYFAWPFEFTRPRWLRIDPARFREPMLGLALPRALRNGTITRLPEIRSYDGSAVVAANGERAEPDLVVFATGFDYGLEHASGLIRSDAQWPHVRDCESAHTPRLYFLGLRQCRTLASAYLRGIARDARAVAARIARN